MKKINNILKITLISSLLIPINTLALTKNESVFSLNNTDGSINKITVTNHLKVNTKEEIIDNTNIEKIVNTNGNETFTKDGSTIKWKANGKDIYYEGDTNKTLPINMKIKYFLDDKEMNVKDMIGKKGNVKIEITLENNEKHNVKINGKNEEIYTPFIVMAGTIIDSKNNEDITVTNGKVIETGNKNIVTSLASPGLYESLDIDKLNNLNTINISYYTNKFELNNIYVLASPKLIDKNDVKIFDDVDTLSSSINTLEDSINKIENGSNTLKNGTNELLNGVNQINNSLPNEEDNKKNENTLLNLKNTNNQTLTTLTNANSNLNSQLSVIDQKINEATTKKTYVEGQINEVSSKATQASDAYNEYNGKLTQVNGAISSLNQAKNAGVITQEQEQMLATLTGQKQSLDTIVPLLLNQKNALEGTLSSLNGTKEAIDGTLTLLNSTKESINTSIDANNKLSMLISGNNKVVDSSINTINSMRKLKDGMNSLSTGASKLNEGANTLNDGINRFNNQGIHTLTNYTYKIKNYSNKAQALIDLSNQYKGFTSNNSDETIFINKVKSEK